MYFFALATPLSSNPSYNRSFQIELKPSFNTHGFSGVLLVYMIFFLVQVIQNKLEKSGIGIHKSPYLTEPDKPLVPQSVEQSLWSCPYDLCQIILGRGYNNPPPLFIKSIFSIARVF